MPSGYEVLWAEDGGQLLRPLGGRLADNEKLGSGKSRLPSKYIYASLGELQNISRYTALGTKKKNSKLARNCALVIVS